MPSVEPGYVVDRIIEVAELGGLRPIAPAYRIRIGHDGAPQGEHQADHVLGDGVESVITDVDDSDAEFLGGLLVDDVGAGGGDSDELEIGQLLQRVGAHGHLVDQCDLGTLQALDDLFRRPGRLVFGIFMREIEFAHLGIEGFTVEEDDFVRHWKPSSDVPRQARRYAIHTSIDDAPRPARGRPREITVIRTSRAGFSRR